MPASMRTSPSRMEPESGVSSQFRHRRKVLLPQPLGPISLAGGLMVVDAVEHAHCTEAFLESVDLDHVLSLRSRARAASEAVWPIAK